jgi:hypothetical protein
VTTGSSQQLWIIAPLLEAGLGLDEVRELLFLVNCELQLDRGPTAPGPIALLCDRRPRIRAAWIETVDRMLRA